MAALHPLAGLLLLGALSRPVPRDLQGPLPNILCFYGREVELAAHSPLVCPSAVFRLEQVSTRAIAETGAFWLTWTPHLPGIVLVRMLQKAG